MDKLITWWREFVNNANSRGVPLPLSRDPKTGQGSISVTMVQISFMLAALPTLLMTGTVLAKLTGVFNLTDATSQQLQNAFSTAIQLYIVSYSGYLGRKLQRDSKGSLTVEEEPKEAPKAP